MAVTLKDLSKVDEAYVPMGGRYIMALDSGTTSVRAVIVDEYDCVVAQASRRIKTTYPQPGWVEQDPMEILASQIAVMMEVQFKSGIHSDRIAAIGITNQRETTVVWDRDSGLPIHNAIVWQCRRTSDISDALIAEGKAPVIRAKTGLMPDPYFSGTKIKWILDNVEGAREAAERGELAFGTVDSWLIWTLTYGRVHATDVTNASRTMLYDIHAGRWDEHLLDLFDIPASMMPEVRPSAASFGETSNPGLVQGIPICGVAGDQQAALFGQRCFKAGMAKNTYGTGCFLLMHTGHEACESSNGLVTTIAASAPGTEGTEYALEGSVFMAGALVQWLRDELGLIDAPAQTEALAKSVPDTGGVYIVPAFTGLGAPYWDAEARGAIFGLTRGTGKAHIVRAALEALAYQVLDLVVAMEEDSGITLSTLNVDGGASANDFLLQFQADIMDRILKRPRNTETTALGAAYLAGLRSGFWKDVDEISRLGDIGDVFSTKMASSRRHELIDGWHEAVGRTRTHRA